MDVAVLDLRLPDGEGTNIISELRTRNPHCVALVLIANLDLAVYTLAVEARVMDTYTRRSSSRRS